MNCCKCNQPGTVRSPGGSWYCEEHSHCARCGCSVADFVLHKYHGTIPVEIYVCPSCVAMRGLIYQRKEQEKALGKRKSQKIANGTMFQGKGIA